MVTLLITSVLILGLAAIAIYFWQKPANSEQANELPPATPPRALFAEVDEPAPVPDSAAPENNGKWHIRITEGDLGALTESKDSEVYESLLNAAVSNASTDAKLLKLASFVATNELPVNRSLAEAMMRSWEQSPDRQTTAKMLHFVALSDNAELYQKAIERSLQLWREEKLAGISATELQALFNGEFWLLSGVVRSSGNGFVLKRTLSSARRELEGTTNN
jgi:hypothetical protein